ncbi:hypothetical protein ACSAZK_03245 [Methanosarcina sp. Mfa9]|uniref:hypothetical protein n=1 Tax=Methanosarcina sp. Mfa9 TaxID=3439063 RepID=UPI003F8495A2
MEYINIYRECLISFDRGLQNLEVLSFIKRILKMKQMEDKDINWREFEKELLGDYIEFLGKLRGNYFFDGRISDNFNIFAYDILNSTYDWEGYRLRLYLAFCIDKSGMFSPKYYNKFLPPIFGQSENDVKINLENGISLFMKILEGKNVHKDEINHLWIFCSDCILKDHCMLSFAEDILPILAMPYNHHSSEDCGTINSLMNQVFDTRINAHLLNYISKNFDQTYSGWATASNYPLAFPQIQDRNALKLNLEVTSQIIAYLSISDNFNSFCKIKGLDSEKLYKDWLNSLKLKQNPNILKSPKSDGCYIHDGLWNSWTVGNSNKITEDCSLSVTIHIGKSLILSYEKIPEELKDDLANDLLSDIIKYCILKLNKDKFLTYTYGRDQYCDLSPVSDVRGAILIADFFLDMIDCGKNNPKLRSCLKQAGIYSPFSKEITNLISYIVSFQEAHGWWPLLSKSYMGNKSKLKLLIRSLEEDGNSYEMIETFDVFGSNPMNISFTNSLEAMSVLYRYLCYLGFRVCPKCNRKLFSFYCPDCGSKSEPQFGD